MKRIRLDSFGFTRAPEYDFSDDGARFTCYTIGTTRKMRVSKSTYEGEVFLSGRYEDSMLSHDVYSKLPHYRALDNLNGVRISSLTETDLEAFAEACIEYEKEYLATAEKEMADRPSLEDYIHYYEDQLEEYQREFAEVKAQITIDKLLDYDDTTVRKIIRILNECKKAATPYNIEDHATYVYSLNGADARKNVKEHKISPLYYYTQLKDFLAGKTTYLY